MPLSGNFQLNWSNKSKIGDFIFHVFRYSLVCAWIATKCEVKGFDRRLHYMFFLLFSGQLLSTKVHIRHTQIWSGVILAFASSTQQSTIWPGEKNQKAIFGSGIFSKRDITYREYFTASTNDNIVWYCHSTKHLLS